MFSRQCFAILTMFYHSKPILQYRVCVSCYMIKKSTVESIFSIKAKSPVCVCKTIIVYPITIPQNYTVLYTTKELYCTTLYTVESTILYTVVHSTVLCTLQNYTANFSLILYTQPYTLLIHKQHSTLCCILANRLYTILLVMHCQCTKYFTVIYCSHNTLSIVTYSTVLPVQFTLHIIPKVQFVSNLPISEITHDNPGKIARVHCTWSCNQGKQKSNKKQDVAAPLVTDPRAPTEPGKRILQKGRIYRMVLCLHTAT